MKFRKCAAFLAVVCSLLFTACDIRVDVETFPFDIYETESDGDYNSAEYIIDADTSDYLAVHKNDIADIDFDELISYQEAAVYLPDTADLDAISYRIVNGNKPFFSDELKTVLEFELYSELDERGRCGMAFANISPYTMPDSERGSIGNIKPSGWKSVKYDIVSGKYLYNRCHLIGYQLAAENANKQNLITGTRHLNVQSMLGFENAAANYVKETGNHVLYAVTPVFIENELVARGVLMEAYSVEDNGEGLQFCAFCYNIQPGIIIDYSTGDSAVLA